MADGDLFAIEPRRLPGGRFPHFIAHRIVNDADYDVVAMAQCDGDTEMWDAIEIVHRAVDGIHDPMPVASLVSCEAFFAENGVIGKAGEEHLSDELLRFHIEGELDVVSFKGIDVEWRAEVTAQ